MTTWLTFYAIVYVAGFSDFHSEGEEVVFHVHGKEVISHRYSLRSWGD